MEKQSRTSGAENPSQWIISTICLQADTFFDVLDKSFYLLSSDN
jgi:hypothetical protein